MFCLPHQNNLPGRKWPVHSNISHVIFKPDSLSESFDSASLTFIRPKIIDEIVESNDLDLGSKRLWHRESSILTPFGGPGREFGVLLRVYFSLCAVIWFDNALKIVELSLKAGDWTLRLIESASRPILIDYPVLNLWHLKIRNQTDQSWETPKLQSYPRSHVKTQLNSTVELSLYMWPGL